MEAMLVAMRDLAMDVADLKGVVYHAWEGPAEWAYVEKGVEYKKHYSERCREARGTGTRLGHMKNYIAFGMYLAYRGDREAPPEDRKRMGDLVGARVRDTEGKMDLMNAKNLDEEGTGGGGEETMGPPHPSRYTRRKR